MGCNTYNHYLENKAHILVILQIFFPGVKATKNS